MCKAPDGGRAALKKRLCRTKLFDPGRSCLSPFLSSGRSRGYMAKSMARISFDHDLSVSTLRRITKAALALAAWVVAPMLDNAGRGSHRLIEMARIGFPIAHAAIAGGGSTSLAEVHGFGACIVTVAADGDPGCRPLRRDTAVSASRWVTREGSRRSGTNSARRSAMPRPRSIPASSMTPPSEEIRHRRRRR